MLPSRSSPNLMRVLFIGTGDIGLPSLRWLINTPKHQVVAVVTQPDKPVGRKLILTPPATKTLALKHSIPVLQPLKIRNALDELRPLQADIAIVVAYGQILSRAVLDIPRLGCLNIHASILPRHRGAAPIQAAIRDGDPESGVTIMYMDEGLDTGDILHITRTPLTESDTGASLHDRLADLAPAAPQPPSFAAVAKTAPARSRKVETNIYGEPIGEVTTAPAPTTPPPSRVRSPLAESIEKEIIPNAPASPPPDSAAAIAEVRRAAEALLRAGRDLEFVAQRTRLPLEEVRLLSQLVVGEIEQRARQAAPEPAPTPARASPPEVPPAPEAKTDDPRLGVLSPIRRSIETV